MKEKDVNDLKQENKQLTENLDVICNELKNVTSQVNEEKKSEAKKLKVNKVEDLKAHLEKASSVEAAAAEESEVCKKETEDILNEKYILEEEVQFLKLSDKNQRSINIRLNNYMNSSRSRLLEEKDKAAKAFKQEIKLWKKKLGNERRKKIKLERKLSKEREAESTNSKLSSSIISTKPIQSSIPNLIEEAVDEPKEEQTCNICAEIIPNYTPKFFQGLLINPACSNCDDSLDEEGLDDENYEDLYYDDDLPPHHYGSDGEVLID
jgi:hypothetical protein